MEEDYEDLGSENEYIDLCESDEVDEDLEEWVCKHCTLKNEAFAGDCSACGMPNEANPEADQQRELRQRAGTSNAFADLAAQTLGYVKANEESAEHRMVLDNCGCPFDRTALEEHIQGLVETLPSTFSEIDAHFCCPKSACQKKLARRDIVSLLDTRTVNELDEKIFRAMEAELEGSRTTPQPKKAKAAAPPAPSNPAIALARATLALETALGLQRRPAEKCSAPEPEPAAKKPRGKAKGLASPPGKTPLPPKGIAKGTGYGGNERHPGMMRGAGATHSTAAASKQLEARQKEERADNEALEALEDIHGRVDAATGRLGGNRMLQSPSFLVCCAVFGGPLPLALRCLLQNDSLLDIGRRGELYWGLLRLVQSLARCVDFIPLFLKPTDPEDPTVASAVLDSLQTLNVQCKVFKRNADDFNTEAETLALGLALEINNSYDELERAAAVLRPAQERLEASLHHRRQADKPEAALTEAEIQADLERRYCNAVGKHRLNEWPIIALRDFYFRKDTQAAATSSSVRKSALRIGQEMSSMATSLPLGWASSVFVVTDESRLDVIRAMIVGPENTPYENGLYLFDILLPPNYPELPPKVQFLTTGGGRARMNPNLYNEGKVCLSLLGTWSGPSWDPAHSTLLQVLISIQSMILISDPYFNEPGYESTANTASGQAASESYNRNIRNYNLRYALLPALIKPPPAFKEVLKLHFTHKKAALLKQMDDWTRRDPGLGGLAAEIRTALEAYDLEDLPKSLCHMYLDGL